MPRVLVSGLMAFGLAACPGCGEADGLYPVSGEVRYKGEPAVGATVSFIPKGHDAKGQVPRAEVESDGSFRLVSGDLGPGAAPGEYAVLVEWRRGPLRTHRQDTARSLGPARAREGKPLLIADDHLRGRYADVTHPRLAAEVKPGRNNLPAFDIAD